jgi:hypothetical protein
MARVPTPHHAGKHAAGGFDLGDLWTLWSGSGPLLFAVAKAALAADQVVRSPGERGW